MIYNDLLYNDMKNNWYKFIFGIIDFNILFGYDFSTLYFNSIFHREF